MIRLSTCHKVLGFLLPNGEVSVAKGRPEIHTCDIVPEFLCGIVSLREVVRRHSSSDVVNVVEANVAGEPTAQNLRDYREKEKRRCSNQCMILGIMKDVEL